jgi:hypothetical protein
MMRIMRRRAERMARRINGRAVMVARKVEIRWR